MMNKVLLEGEVSEINLLKNGDDFFTNFTISNDSIKIHCVNKSDKNFLDIEEGKKYKIEGSLSFKVKRNKYWHQINVSKLEDYKEEK